MEEKEDDREKQPFKRIRLETLQQVEEANEAMRGTDWIDPLRSVGVVLHQKRPKEGCDSCLSSPAGQLCKDHYLECLCGKKFLDSASFRKHRGRGKIALRVGKRFISEQNEVSRVEEHVLPAEPMNFDTEESEIPESLVGEVSGVFSNHLLEATLLSSQYNFQTLLDRAPFRMTIASTCRASTLSGNTENENWFLESTPFRYSVIWLLYFCKMKGWPAHSIDSPEKVTKYLEPGQTVTEFLRSKKIDLSHSEDPPLPNLEALIAENKLVMFWCSREVPFPLLHLGAQSLLGLSRGKRTVYWKGNCPGSV